MQRRKRIRPSVRETETKSRGLKLGAKWAFGGGMANVSTFPPGPMAPESLVLDDLMFDGSQRRRRGAVVVVSLLLVLVAGFVGVTVFSRLLH